MTDTTPQPELPRVSRSIARTTTAAWPWAIAHTTTRTWPHRSWMRPTVGGIPSFAGLLSARLRLLTLGIDLPRLSYLVAGWGGENGRETTGSAESRSRDHAPSGRSAPAPETTLRTVVRELVRTRTSPLTRPPLTARQDRSGVLDSVGVPTGSTEAPTADAAWTGPETQRRRAGWTALTDVERSVVRHDERTLVAGETNGPPSASSTPVESTAARESLALTPGRLGSANAATTPRAGLHGAVPTVVRHGPDDGPGGRQAGDGRRSRSTAWPQLTVTTPGDDARSAGGTPRVDGPSERPDAFGPTADLTVRRTGGASRNGTATGGAETTRSVDLADLGGTSDRPGGPGPSASPASSQAPPTRPSLDLSQAPRAEVDRLVDRLYGEIARRHRIERERRGR